MVALPPIQYGRVDIFMLAAQWARWRVQKIQFWSTTRWGRNRSTHHKIPVSHSMEAAPSADFSAGADMPDVAVHFIVFRLASIEAEVRAPESEPTATLRETKLRQN